MPTVLDSVSAVEFEGTFSTCKVDVFQLHGGC